MTIANKLSPPTWMLEPDTERIFGALNEAGHTIRFVGGCIRDTIAGHTVSDIDLATDALPERVSGVLSAAEIRVVPTGIDHGTVTALVGERAFEITTLRKDVATNGRRAQVEFTDDWYEDAARRDFTFNALSADRDGRVYDYFNGLEDLNAGKVRFIGDALERVKEDYLRILRFFRFHAYFAKSGPDPESFAACRSAVTHVETLSGERIWNELSRTLVAPNPVFICQLMEEIGLLGLLLPVERVVPRVEALSTLEKMLSLEPDPIRRLTALIAPNRSQTLNIAARLKFSRADTRRLENLICNRGVWDIKINGLSLRRALYSSSSDQVCDFILLSWADEISSGTEGMRRSQKAWRDVWEIASAWTSPEFPLDGRDIVEIGIKEGPMVGEILSEMEEWWVGQSFQPDRKACLTKLKRLVCRQ
ncbi:MAG: CCA tRNA nucleotidyltransferase [Pseudomonadota bacterium]|nr:CCA tRNA nucleotidyltransferase [Pseudomonadota bacterium]